MAQLGWPPRDLATLERSLDELALAVDVAPTQRPDEEQIWLSRLLVVRSCGYLEQVLHACAISHIEWRSGGTARSYALSWLERSINPSPANIVRTLGRFDHDLEEEFRAMLEDNSGRLNQELSVLLAKRHSIAHGLNEGTGSRRALDLYKVAKEVANWLIVRLNPDPARGSAYSR